MSQSQDEPIKISALDLQKLIRTELRRLLSSAQFGGHIHLHFHDRTHLRTPLLDQIEAEVNAQYLVIEKTFLDRWLVTDWPGVWASYQQDTETQ